MSRARTGSVSVVHAIGVSSPAPRRRRSTRTVNTSDGNGDIVLPTVERAVKEDCDDVSHARVVADEATAMADQEVDVDVDEDADAGAAAYPRLYCAHAKNVRDSDDMICMGQLTLESLLANLRSRYQRDLIYTAIGPSILVAVNPYKVLPHMYSGALMRRYMGEEEFTEMPPHVFQIISLIYRNMRESGMNQSVVVSGESGAGKTETCKCAINFLTSVTSRDHLHSPRDVSPDTTGVASIEDRLITANTLCESFGNACTVRNHNSSRFGKLIKIHFGADGAIVGSHITQYLLEKSRVVSIADRERTYHVFYELVNGSPESMRAELALDVEGGFKMLNQSSKQSIDGWDESVRFSVTARALDIVGIDDQRQQEIWRILASILHLSNVEFIVHPGEEEHATIANDQALAHAAMCLRMPHETLRTALLTKSTGGMRVIQVPLNREQATANCEALRKRLYSMLFRWIIHQLNETLRVDHSESETFIALLDIFGFENFATNSLEQLCINYTNEQLQQYFNQHVFKLEEEEYEREGIEWSAVEFTDNLDCLDLIGKKPIGVFDLLTEECTFPRGTDSSFLDKVAHNHRKKKTSVFSIKPRSRNEFTVRHYAGEVAYRVTGFLEKNKDHTHAHVVNAMEHSECDLIKLMENVATAEGSPQKKPMLKRGSSGRLGIQQTVVHKYRAQLALLMQELEKTTSYFIRCVRPNNVQAADNFMDEYIMEQLINVGVMETIRIRQSGFPTRMTHSEFVKNYELFLSHLSRDQRESTPVVDVCSLIFQNIQCKDHSEYQVGRTKIFLKQGIALDIERQKRSHLGFLACVIQKEWRRYIQQKKYRRMKEASILLQASTRRFLSFSRYQKMRGAVALLKRWVRYTGARRRYLHDRTLVVTLQSYARFLLARLQYVRDHAKLLRLQSYVRMWVMRKQYLAAYRKIIVLQSWTRLSQLRGRYVTQQRACGVLQSYSRMLAMRRAYVFVQGKVLLLECFGRMLLARTSYIRSRADIIRLQSWRRMLLQRRELVRQCKATGTLQRWFRHVKQRRLYLHDRDRVIHLQTWFRRSSSRLAFLRQRRSAMCLESFRRMFSVRQKFVRERTFAIVLQSYARGVAQRRVYVALRHATIVLQSMARTWRNRNGFKQARARIIMIQSGFRTALALKERDRKENAIEMLQRVWRMAAQRRQYLEWRRAATILQSMWRAKQARVQLRTAQQSVVLLQSTYRALSARRRKVAAVGALKQLQSAVRMWLGRSSYLRERCVDCFETTCRPLFLASSITNQRNRFARQSAACKVLQRWTRGFQARRRYVQVTQNVRLMQTMARCFIACRARARAGSAIVRLQCAARMYLASLKLAQLRREHIARVREASAVVLQSLWRHYDQRKRFLRLRRSCVILQCYARAIAAKRKLMDLKEAEVARRNAASVVLQSAWRSNRAQRQLGRDQASVRLLQAMVRQAFVRRRYLRLRNACITIECAVRGWNAVRYKNAALFSVQLLQDFWRFVQARRALQFLRATEAAVLLQRAFRRHLVLIPQVRKREREAIERRLARLELDQEPQDERSDGEEAEDCRGQMELVESRGSGLRRRTPFSDRLGVGTAVQAAQPESHGDVVDESSAFLDRARALLFGVTVERVAEESWTATVRSRGQLKSEGKDIDRVIALLEQCRARGENGQQDAVADESEQDGEVSVLVQRKCTTTSYSSSGLLRHPMTVAVLLSSYVLVHLLMALLA